MVCPGYPCIDLLPLAASLSVIAGTPYHLLTAGPLPSNGVLSLSPFISSSSPPAPVITWEFNGRVTDFPPGTRVLGAEVLLRSPITGDMRGNYTCRVRRAGVTATTVFQIQVNGKLGGLSAVW